VNSSRSVDITAQTGSVASSPWPTLRGSCSLAGKLQEPRSHPKADVATVHDSPIGFISLNFAKRYGHDPIKFQEIISHIGTIDYATLNMPEQLI